MTLKIERVVWYLWYKKYC